MSKKTWQARAVLRDAYLEKVIDHLQGETDGPTYAPFRGEDFDHPAAGKVSSNIPIKSVLHGIQKTVSDPETGKKHKDQVQRPFKVAGPAD